MQWEATLRNDLDRASRKLRAESRPCQAWRFPAAYQALNTPRQALRDVLRLEEVARRGAAIADLRVATDASPPARYRLRIFTEQDRGLDELTPLLHNIGLRVLDQIHFRVSVEGRSFSIRSFDVARTGDDKKIAVESKKPALRALNALLAGAAEDDSLNQLILSIGLNWWEVDLFRAYCSFYHQLGVRFVRSRIQQTLVDNAEITRLLFAYFDARFNPDGRWRDALHREVEGLTPIRSQLIAAFDNVVDVNEDRILRDIFNLIDATSRANFYRRREEPCRFLSFKISSIGVINMPNPKPVAEIYVYSRLMEGVHLRGSKVARGGVRWSDRPDDFRTEILGLMQTQMVKNALIVPQGAKGGFVVKSCPGDARERKRLGEEAYDAFIRGLLDLTDNIVGRDVVTPPGLITYDGDDPYLVVAADKGTAGWSDRANRIAAEYSYWLGDAFATGGSRGYHHKHLGITARGAWVCVKRHFLELGVDIDQQAVSVVGVGGMEGDVFGNGVLQSRNLRLMGAFDGTHIFVDPEPDPLASYAERKRLFEGGGSWADYDRSAISQGGGVFLRAAKDIPLTQEMREWLGARNMTTDGDGLVRLLLGAPVDLLWMGGVGAYVRGAAETDETVGDRANDGARIDAAQLRAKVVGEGANLGFTQRARIEYALKGGRINTDAIDNSAGVDLSDHEVNLKVSLALATRGESRPLSDDDRARLLASVMDDVCQSVVTDNYRQSVCLSLDWERCRADPSPFMTLADRLETAGFLDRDVEHFPSAREFVARKGQRLTRPELAVLLAYAKLALKRILLDSTGVGDEEWTGRFLDAYFPQQVRTRCAAGLTGHPLRSEIIATMICNRVIDQAGSSFLTWNEEMEPTFLANAVRTYLTFDEILEGERWRAAVYALDAKATPTRQYDLLLQLEDTLAFLCRWALTRGQPLVPETGALESWRHDMRQFTEHLRESSEFAIVNSAAPDAARLLFINRLRDFPILVLLSRRSGEKLRVVADRFDAGVEFMGLRQILTHLADVVTRDGWEKRLRRTLDERLRAAAGRLARLLLQARFRDPALLFNHCGMEAGLIDYQRLRQEMLENETIDLARFAALGGTLDALLDACVERSE